jgi:hypothetical protein
VIANAIQYSGLPVGIASRVTVSISHSAPHATAKIRMRTRTVRKRAPRRESRAASMIEVKRLEFERIMLAVDDLDFRALLD